MSHVLFYGALGSLAAVIVFCIFIRFFGMWYMRGVVVAAEATQSCSTIRHPCDHYVFNPNTCSLYEVRAFGHMCMPRRVKGGDLVLVVDTDAIYRVGPLGKAKLVSMGARNAISAGKATSVSDVFTVKVKHRSAVVLFLNSASIFRAMADSRNSL